MHLAFIDDGSAGTIDSTVYRDWECPHGLTALSNCRRCDAEVATLLADMGEAITVV